VPAPASTSGDAAIDMTQFGDDDGPGAGEISAGERLVSELVLGRPMTVFEKARAHPLAAYRRSASVIAGLPAFAAGVPLGAQLNQPNYLPYGVSGVLTCALGVLLMNLMHRYGLRPETLQRLRALAEADDDVPMRRMAHQLLSIIEGNEQASALHDLLRTPAAINAILQLREAPATRWQAAASLANLAGMEDQLRDAGVPLTALNAPGRTSPALNLLCARQLIDTHLGSLDDLARTRLDAAFRRAELEFAPVANVHVSPAFRFWVDATEAAPDLETVRPSLEAPALARALMRESGLDPNLLPAELPPFDYRQLPWLEGTSPQVTAFVRDRPQVQAHLLRATSADPVAASRARLHLSAHWILLSAFEPLSEYQELWRGACVPDFIALLDDCTTDADASVHRPLARELTALAALYRVVPDAVLTPGHQAWAAQGPLSDLIGRLPGDQRPMAVAALARNWDRARGSVQDLLHGSNAARARAAMRLDRVAPLHTGITEGELVDALADEPGPSSAARRRLTDDELLRLRGGPEVVGGGRALVSRSTFWSDLQADASGQPQTEADRVARKNRTIDRALMALQSAGIRDIPRAALETAWDQLEADLAMPVPAALGAEDLARQAREARNRKFEESIAHLAPEEQNFMKSVQPLPAEERQQRLDEFRRRRELEDDQEFEALIAHMSPEEQQAERRARTTRMKQPQAGPSS
jgi:hypothetical protein